MYKKLGYLGAFFIIFYYFLKEAIWRGIKKVVRESLQFLLEEGEEEDNLVAEGGDADDKNHRD